MKKKKVKGFEELFLEVTHTPDSNNEQVSEKIVNRPVICIMCDHHFTSDSTIQAVSKFKGRVLVKCTKCMYWQNIKKELSMPSAAWDNYKGV